MQKLFLTEVILTAELSPESSNALKNGSFRHQEQPGRPKTLAPDVEERVDLNPVTSTRRVAMQEEISASNVWRVLHHPLYPYNIQRVQGLKNTDFLLKFTFCQQIQQSALDRQFLNNVLFTDEAGFTCDGIFNFHNCHVWES